MLLVRILRAKNLKEKKICKVKDGQSGALLWALLEGHF